MEDFIFRKTVPAIAIKIRNMANNDPFKEESYLAVEMKQPELPPPETG